MPPIMARAVIEIATDLLRRPAQWSQVAKSDLAWEKESWGTALLRHRLSGRHFRQNNRFPTYLTYDHWLTAFRRFAFLRPETASHRYWRYVLGAVNHAVAQPGHHASAAGMSPRRDPEGLSEEEARVSG